MHLVPLSQTRSVACPLTRATVVGQVGVTSRGQRRVTAPCPNKRGWGGWHSQVSPPPRSPGATAMGTNELTGTGCRQQLLSPWPPREDPPALPARDKEQVVSKQGGGRGGWHSVPGLRHLALCGFCQSREVAAGPRPHPALRGGHRDTPGWRRWGRHSRVPPAMPGVPCIGGGWHCVPPGSLNCLCFQPWFINKLISSSGESLRPLSQCHPRRGVGAGDTAQ